MKARGVGGSSEATVVLHARKAVKCFTTLNRKAWYPALL
jgi:hypothetical protein